MNNSSSVTLIDIISCVELALGQNMDHDQFTSSNSLASMGIRDDDVSVLLDEIGEAFDVDLEEDDVVPATPVYELIRMIKQAKEK